MPKPNTRNSKMRTRSTHQGALLTLSTSTPNKNKPATRRRKKPRPQSDPPPDQETSIHNDLEPVVPLMESASTSRPRKLVLSHVEIPIDSTLSPIREVSIPSQTPPPAPGTTPTPNVPSPLPSPPALHAPATSPVNPLLDDESGSDYEATRQELHRQRRRKGIQSDSEEDDQEEPRPAKRKASAIPASTPALATTSPTKTRWKQKKKLATVAHETSQSLAGAGAIESTPFPSASCDDGDLYPVIDDDDPDIPPSLKTRGPLPKDVKSQLDAVHEQYLMEVKKIASTNNLAVQRCLDYLKAGIQIAPRGVNRYNAFQAFYSHFHPKPDDVPAALYRHQMSEAYNYVCWRNNCLPDDIELPFINEVAEGQPGTFVSHPDQPLPEADVHEMVWYAEWYGKLIDHILNESKVSGSFRAQAHKILKPFLALAYNALINNGVHIFGYLIDTRRDANGMSASSIWGNSPDFHEVHAKHRVDIQAQTFNFEAMFRMVEMAKRGRDIPPMVLSHLRNPEMLTGKECSWNNFLRNAASLQLRLCNWPINVPFPGLPGGPKECRKGDYDEFLPDKEQWIRELLDGKISAEQQRTPKCVYFERWTDEEKNMSHEDQENIAIVRMVDGTDYVYARDSESWVTGKEVHSDDEDPEDAGKPKKVKRSGRGRKQSKKDTNDAPQVANDIANPAKPKAKAAAKPASSLSGDVFNDDNSATCVPKGKGKQKQLVLNSPPNRELSVPNVDEDPRLDPTVPLQDIEDALFQAASSLDEDPDYDESTCYELLGSYLRPGTAAYRAWVGHFLKISKSRSASLPSVEENLNEYDAVESDSEPLVGNNDITDNDGHTPASAHEALVALHEAICTGDRHIGDAYAMLDDLLHPESEAYELWKAHFNLLNEASDEEAVPDPPDVLLQFHDPMEDQRTPTPPPITFDEHPSVQLRRLFPKIDLSKHVTAHSKGHGKPAQNRPSNVPAKAVSVRHATPQPEKPRPTIPRTLTQAVPIPSRSHQPTVPPASLILPQTIQPVKGLSVAPTKVIKPSSALRQVLVGPSSTQPPSQASSQQSGAGSKRPVPERAYIGAPGYKGPTDYFDSSRKRPVKRQRLEAEGAGTSSSKLR
ncbi:hypothetical protein VNI00_016045 [Paramarasmius palmivorus]|uniref:Uncharacterized protein n=1 Tax=Paramarasmius palmivorus TaxID=297713 RepID=A0AAW0AZ64_9AGAR